MDLSAIGVPESQALDDSNSTHPHWCHLIVTVLRELRHVPRVEASAVAASLILGVVLLAVKFAAYYLTRSAVIFSDALESIVNVAASAVAAYSLFLAHQP